MDGEEGEKEATRMGGEELEELLGAVATTVLNLTKGAFVDV